MVTALVNSQQLWLSVQDQAGKHPSLKGTGAREPPSLADEPLVTGGCEGFGHW